MEKKYIQDCIRSGKKVLGICLGAQLIAASLGAGVQKAPNKEIGWFSVRPTKAAERQRWFYELFKDHPLVFHWHGDQFDIPEGCMDLLSSNANGHQAFSYREQVIGLQFHLEVTEQIIRHMLQEAACDLDSSRYVQSASLITFGTPLLKRCHEIMAQILTCWLMQQHREI